MNCIYDTSKSASEHDDGVEGMPNHLRRLSFRRFRRLANGLRFDGELVIQLMNAAFQWKWVYDAYSLDDMNWRTVVCSRDLLTMLALLLVDLVPVGVVADRIQEELPELEPVAEFLRRWENLKRWGT